MVTGGSFGKRISRIEDKSWSQSFNSARFMLCCMVRKANGDIILGTEASYLMNKLDIYNTNKDKNQISNQNHQHLSSPRRKSALYFKGRWNMDLKRGVEQIPPYICVLGLEQSVCQDMTFKKNHKKFSPPTRTLTENRTEWNHDNFTMNKDSPDNSGKTELEGKDARREWEGRRHKPCSLIESGSSNSSNSKQQQKNWTSSVCKVDVNNRISSTPDTDRLFLWRWQNVEILASTSILWSGVKWPITPRYMICIVTKKKETLPSKNLDCAE